MPKREPIRAAPGSWHLLTMFTANRQPIFNDPALAATMQSALNAARERHGLRVVAYCIMPGYFQWLVQVTEYSLECFALAQRRRGDRLSARIYERFIDRLMNDVRGRSAAALRATDPRLPHDPWMPGFFHDPIHDAARLAVAIAAVHTAPVRAKLVGAPGDYAYSSYAHVVDGKPSLVTIDPVPRGMAPNGARPTPAEG